MLKRDFFGSHILFCDHYCQSYWYRLTPVVNSQKPQVFYVHCDTGTSWSRREHCHTPNAGTSLHKNCAFKSICVSPKCCMAKPWAKEKHSQEMWGVITITNNICFPVRWLKRIFGVWRSRKVCVKPEVLLPAVALRWRSWNSWRSECACLFQLLGISSPEEKYLHSALRT